MKKYVKPTFELIELRPEEMLAIRCKGCPCCCNPCRPPWTGRRKGTY